MVDPQIAYQYKDAVNQSVPNPFYNILTRRDKFPGLAPISAAGQHLIIDEAISAVRHLSP